MPSGSTRLTAAFLYSFPVTVLKSSACATEMNDRIRKLSTLAFTSCLNWTLSLLVSRVARSRRIPFFGALRVNGNAAQRSSDSNSLQSISLCHSERSEESRINFEPPDRKASEMFRFAQHDRAISWDDFGCSAGQYSLCKELAKPNAQPCSFCRDRCSDCIELRANWLPPRRSRPARRSEWSDRDGDS